jgi:predicted O-linked N-acetylglucosamine transferase (SPINDLY family)
VNPEPTLDAAIQHHRAGRLHEAEKLYRQILASNPQHPDALHMLGVLAHQSGDNITARELIARSIAVRPGVPDAHANLGLVLQSLGETDGAIECYRQALRLTPNQAEFHTRLGVALKAAGKLDEAVEALQTAVGLNPSLAAAHNNLGNAYHAQHRREDAIRSYRRALSLRSDYVEAINNYANCLRESGDAGSIVEAIYWYRKALALRPKHPELLAHFSDALEDRREFTEAINYRRQLAALKPDDAQTLIRLGNALMNDGSTQEAISVYSRAVSLDAASAVAQFDLGCALHAAARPDEAIDCFRRALALTPDFSAAANNLGSALKDTGRLDESLSAFAQALAIEPNYQKAEDNLVYAQLFHPAIDREQQLASLRRWDHRYAKPLACDVRPTASECPQDRPLRIGYVSPDFRDHVVGRNVLPVLTNHDRHQFQIYCYSNVERPDPYTDRFRAASHAWRDITRFSDADAAEMIRRDGIGILVDLALHMSGNRLLIFARKPAPVQMTWAGYPGTTGLDTIDYRISDPHLDPPGANEAEFYSEKTVCLPHSFWCYDPSGVDLPIGAPPVEANGYITFGCLNNFCKVNQPTLSLWSELLRAVPSSRLHLLAPEGFARRWVFSTLQAAGVDPVRLTFHTVMPRLDYLRLYHQIDIALDTFPYNGHTTSLDAMWMGVPLLTIAGSSPVARAGVSQLTNLGLTELIADSGEYFVRIGTQLAANRARLRSLRTSLRGRFEASPLRDVAQFTKDLEAIYRATWRHYRGGT